MDIKECYEILGITKKATDEQVKKAYREKSKQFHPDLHRDDKDATAKFAKVSEAYRLILEIVKRNTSLYLTLVLYSAMPEVRRIQKRRKKQQNQKSLSLSRKVFEVLTYILQ